MALEAAEPARAFRRPGDRRELRRKLRNIPGTNVTITNPPSIRVGGRGRALQLSIYPAGPGFGASCRTPPTGWSRRCRKIPVFVGVNSDQDKAAPSLQVDIDRNRAAALGVTPDADRNRDRLWPLAASRFRRSMPPSDQYQVVLELLPQYQLDAAALSRLYLTSNDRRDGAAERGRPTLSRRTMVQTINHAGQIPAITVSFDLAPGKALSDAVSQACTAPPRDRHARHRLRALLPAPRPRSRARPPIWAC